MVLMPSFLLSSPLSDSSYLQSECLAEGVCALEEGEREERKREAGRDTPPVQGALHPASSPAYQEEEDRSAA